ncbi:MAG TPA: hypothetical protein VFV08_07460, partial [Puia sp.]|nr:hypothetical protein [Puia sp.]
MNSLSQRALQISPFLFAGIFFITIFGLNWLGYHARKRISRLHPEKEVSFGAAEGSLYGLMALLLAFSFSIVTTKFESRRQLIIDEANLINSAILRSNLYPDSIKQRLLPDLKQYLESRIAYYDLGDGPGEDKIKTILNESDQHFNSVWSKTNLLTRDKENLSQTEQMVRVLIDMKNIAATREAARQGSVPLLITLVLLILVFVSSFLMGYGVKPGQRNP